MAFASFHGANSKSFYSYSRGTITLVLLFMAMLSLQKTKGAQYTVGDSVGWGLGNDLQSWATPIKFHVGDDLYFSYPPGQHSVLLVTEEDYKSCNREKPITSDNGMGDMVITLDREDTYYFICGVPGHCEQGLRLSIAVEHEEESMAPPPPPEEEDLPPAPPKEDPPPQPHEPEAPPPPKEEAAPPPPKEHDPPPPKEEDAPPPPEEHDPPPPADKLTPPDSPPDSPILSPPYSKYNTFRRNSSPNLSINPLAFATTIIFCILCTFF